ncbi:hypothetical protein CKO23_21950 [Thiocystis violacea]|nr:hypothetical protein [Thiocystis violacea]
MRLRSASHRTLRQINLAMFALALGAGLTTEIAGATDVVGEVYASHKYANEPFPDERAEVWLQGGGKRFEGNSGGGGIFYLYAVPPGTYQLHVESPYGRAERAIRIEDQRRQDLGRTTVSR